MPSSVEFNLDIAHGPGQLDSRLGKVEEVVVAQSGEEEESKEGAEERSAHTTQGSISVSVREAPSVSEVGDGQGDVQAASVVEVDEVEVGEKLGGSVVEFVGENDVVCEDCLLYTSRCV